MPDVTDESEKIAIRYNDGPLPGTHVISTADMPWPPPEQLQVPFMTGHYEKISQSKLDAPMPGMMRGAEYEWHPSSDN